jgi:hypothetical protein
MVNYTFSSNGLELLCQQVPIQTNVASIDIQSLQQRFYSDIIKDSQTEVKVNSIINQLIACYGKNDIIPKTIAQYKVQLSQLETLVFNSAEVKQNVTELNNILKTSTVGSNTVISDANAVFWESGFGSKNICRNTNIVRIGTPAAKLDPLPKEEFTSFFPNPNTNIIFDINFTKRLGFVNTVWKIEKSIVTITYSDNSKISTKVDANTSKDVLFNSPFGNYLLGNNEKNKLINNVPKCSDFFKLVETKELGDVAQVWLYLAYIIINNITDRTTTVMITTDSVVYLFCIILNLSCVYTGSREGVLSGRCTLKHYLAGVPNYTLKIQNMTRVHFDRIIGQNNAIAFGLRIMIIDFRAFEYYRLGGRGGITRTSGEFQVAPIIKPRIIQLFTSYLDTINKLSNDATEFYNNFFNSRTLPLNDNDVTGIYNDFCKQIDTFKCPQFLTKITSKSYVLQPSSLLTEYAAIVSTNGTPITVPQSIGDLSTSFNNIEAPTIVGGKKRKFNGGGLKDSIKMQIEVDYNDCLLLWYVYQRFLYPYIQNNSQSLEKNDDFRILFALFYDNEVSKITETTLLSDLPNFVNSLSISDDEIISNGKYLSTFIYFADDKDVEEKILNEELLNLSKQSIPIERSTRSSGITPFSPNTTCENTNDVLTNQRIDPGKAIYINGKCYSVDSIVQMIVSNIQSNNFANGLFFDPYTRQPLNIKDRDNILRYIKTYYHDLFIWLEQNNFIVGFTGGKRIRVKHKKSIKPLKNKTRKHIKNSLSQKYINVTTSKIRNTHRNTTKHSNNKKTISKNDVHN